MDNIPRSKYSTVVSPGCYWSNNNSEHDLLVYNRLNSNYNFQRNDDYYDEYSPESFYGNNRHSTIFPGTSVITDMSNLSFDQEESEFIPVKIY